MANGSLTPEQIAAARALSPWQRLRWIILEERGLSLNEGARQIGVSGPGLLRWLDEEELRRGYPTDAYRKAIRVWTANSVLGPIEPDEWAPAKELEIVRNVKPFVPNAA